MKPSYQSKAWPRAPQNLSTAQASAAAPNETGDIVKALIKKRKELSSHAGATAASPSGPSAIDGSEVSPAQAGTDTPASTEAPTQSGSDAPASIQAPTQSSSDAPADSGLVAPAPPADSGTQGTTAPPNKNSTAGDQDIDMPSAASPAAPDPTDQSLVDQSYAALDDVASGKRKADDSSMEDDQPQSKKPRSD